ncbi:MAG: MBL fold metallo-hydrolase [Bacilli bacterium]
MSIVKSFVFSYQLLRSNLYLIKVGPHQVVIIDPSDLGEKMLAYLAEHQLTPVAVLLTHGHFDHVRGVKRLIEQYRLPVYVGQGEKDYLHDHLFMRGNYEEIAQSGNLHFVEDGQRLTFGHQEFLVITTPFHSMGSVCYYLEKEGIIFTGDTLFKGTIGRTDIFGSDPTLIKASLNKLRNLPETTVVYPGHGESTTIKDEKNHNPCL